MPVRHDSIRRLVPRSAIAPLRSQTRLSSVVMAHPARRAAAEALRRAHPGLRLRIVSDPEPGRPGGALRTARLAWGAVAEDATHHLVIQDDMEPVAGFEERVHEAILARPSDILCFFTEWGSRSSSAVRLAAAQGTSWAPVLDPYIPTAVTVLPAEVARSLSKHEGKSEPDDVFLLGFTRQHGLSAYVSVPNLAEHASSPSLVGNDLLMGPRRAAYLGETGEPLGGQVWQGTVAPHLPIFESYSICQVRQEDGTWDAVRTHDHLNLDVPEVIAMFHAAMKGRTELATVVAEPMLLQLWLTAFAYGICAEGPLHPAAMRTLAPGALRRFIPLSYLDDLSVLLAPLIEQAIRFAYSRGNSPSN